MRDTAFVPVEEAPQNGRESRTEVSLLGAWRILVAPEFVGVLLPLQGQADRDHGVGDTRSERRGRLLAP
jgi:hypothetical protein